VPEAPGVIVSGDSDVTGFERIPRTSGNEAWRASTSAEFAV
jgi:hypothetical protein